MVALRDFLPRAGLEVLYLPSPGAATGKLASIPGAIRQDVLADIGRALRAEFIAEGRDMVQIEADDGACLIVHAVEVRTLVMAAVNVQLIETR